ncbi:hypothetical protein LshimejAT787_1200970 [Lyophyllum shimeji]|uniref:Uncharacterized protein n=1 Tax=Lyophyllum shimeji TaxID=47721 RepID=A0A9P3PW29_LYOSH|nr:hypothetical protein LshimejAT787_1200970 [Lyophyllum shimeji]
MTALAASFVDSYPRRRLSGAFKVAASWISGRKGVAAVEKGADSAEQAGARALSTSSNSPPLQDSFLPAYSVASALDGAGAARASAPLASVMVPHWALHSPSSPVVYPPRLQHVHLALRLRALLRLLIRWRRGPQHSDGVVEQMGWMQTRCTVPCAPPPNSDVLVAIASNTNLDSSIQMRNPITSATPDSEVRCESHPNNLEAQYDVGDTRRFHPKVEAADSTATSAPPPNRDVLVASLNTQNPSSPSSTSSTEKNTGRVMENVEGDECGNGNEIAAGGPGRRINTGTRN